MPFLDWVNKNFAKDAARKVPYRVLNQKRSYGDVEGSCSDNLIIKGDNLDALKALLPYYSSSVKCIFIDPPYNTQSAFDHYDDKLEHSQWLSMMHPRLVLLRDLLTEDGSIWVSIDDYEAHYLKVLMDEVFGRQNFITTVIWRKNYAPKSSARHFSEDHDYILVYAKNADRWVPNPMPRTDKQDKAYTNRDGDPRGAWRPNNLAARNYYSKGTYSITCPSGRIIDGPPSGSYWRVSEEKFKEMDRDGQIWWGKDGNNVPAPKIYLSKVKQGVVPQTFWNYEEVGHTQEAKKEIVKLFGADVFGTPKPEKLLQRVLHIATKPGDLVVDSFLGSGTTAAVAHKMNRRYIGIELGEHAQTHCVPRLQKVIEGENGGISEETGWIGGGGFRFIELGEAVFNEDGLINESIKFSTLAAHLWHQETRSPATKKFTSPLLGVRDGTAYFLLYNGILGDRRPESGNVLTQAVLKMLNELLDHDGPKVIFGEVSRLGPARLATEQISFKQIPYDLSIS